MAKELEDYKNPSEFVKILQAKDSGLIFVPKVTLVHQFLKLYGIYCPKVSGVLKVGKQPSPSDRPGTIRWMNKLTTVFPSYHQEDAVLRFDFENIST